MPDDMTKGQKGPCSKCQHLDKTKFVELNKPGDPTKRIGACIYSGREEPHCMWGGYLCDYTLGDGWAFNPIDITKNPQHEDSNSLIRQVKYAERLLNDAISKLHDIPDFFVEIEIEQFLMTGQPKPMPQIRTLTSKTTKPHDSIPLFITAKELSCPDWGNCVHGAGCQLSSFVSDSKKMPNIDVIDGGFNCYDHKRG